MRRAFSVTIAVVAVAPLAAACGSKPEHSSSSGGLRRPAAAGKAFNACMVLDTGGVDDKSFNQSSWAGMQAANKANPNIKISYVPSNSGNDYTPNLTPRSTKKCDTILAVGGLMADDVKKVAAANPNAAVRRGRRGLQRPERLRPCSSTPRRAASSAATSPPA